MIKNIKKELALAEIDEKNLNHSQQIMEEKVLSEFSTRISIDEIEDVEFEYENGCEDYEPINDVLDEKDFDIPDDPMPKGELDNLSKKKIWGQLALKLREMGLRTLHSAFVEVRDLDLANGILTAGVKDEYTLNILNDKENFDKISLALRQIDDRISLQFVLKKVSSSKVLQNLKILQDLFGEDLTVSDNLR